MEGFAVGNDVVVLFFAFLAHGVKCRQIPERTPIVSTNPQVEKIALDAVADV